MGRESEVVVQVMVGGGQPGWGDGEGRGNPLQRAQGAL